jgi:hypothetical protein
MAIIQPSQLATGSYSISGSFSGSFQGSGAGLNNIPSSAIVGLSSTQIASGAVSASVSTGTGSFTVTSGSSTFMFVSSSGNVGLGTTTPSRLLHVSEGGTRLSQTFNPGVPTLYVYHGRTENDSTVRFENASGDNLYFGGNGLFVTGNTTIGNGSTTLSARLGVKGSGTTSATTSLLVQNSTGTNILQVRDDGVLRVNSIANLDGTGLVKVPQYLVAQADPFVFKNSSNVDMLYMSTAASSFQTPVTLGLSFGINPNASAQLQINSTTKGFLPPRTDLTSNISTPAQGLMTYVTASATEGLYYYNSGSAVGWHKVLTNSGSQSISGSVNLDNTLYVSGSRVGIGTSTPSQTLDVVGVAKFNLSGTSVILNNPSGRYTDLGLANADSIKSFVSLDNSQFYLDLYSAANYGLRFWTNNAECMRIPATGNVLINTTTDSGYKLDVNGTARMQGNTTIALNQNATTNLSVVNTDTTNASSRARVSVISGTITGSMTAIIGNDLYLGTDSAHNVNFTTAGTTRFNLNNSSGNVSIGVLASDMGARLGIKGSGTTSATTALLVQNSNSETTIIAKNDRTIGLGRNAFNGEGYGGIAIGYPDLGNLQYSSYDAHTFNTYNGAGYETALLIKGNGASSRVLIGPSSDTTYKFQVSGSNSSGSVNLDNTLYVSGSRVGIGTSTPSGRFHVKGSVASEIFKAESTIAALYAQFVSSDGACEFGIYTDALYFQPLPSLANGTRFLNGANTIIMQLAQTGNVGINTTTDAGFRLDVNGTARVQDNLTIAKNQNSLTQINISNTTSGSSASPILNLTSDVASGIFQFGKQSTLTNVYKIIGAKDGFIYNSTTGGDIAILNDFATGKIKFAAGGSSTTQMTVDSTGNIGIGTLTPSASLHISGASSAALLEIDSPAVNNILFVTGSGRVGIGTGTPVVNLQVGDGTNGANSLYVGGNVSSTQTIGFAVNGSTVYHGLTSNANTGEFRIGAGFNGGGHYLVFSSGNNTERMRIASSGNILINTTTDSGYLLDVNGISIMRGILEIQSSSGLRMRSSSGAAATSFRPNGTDAEIRTNDASVASVYFNQNGIVGFSQQAAFGSTTASATSAQVQIDSTTRGFLPPRMTGAQAELISSPAEGLMVYATNGTGVTITSKGWWGYDGATWVKFN